jgi:hypothetical protein
MSFHDREVRVSKLHNRALCHVADADHGERVLREALKRGDWAHPYR